MARASAFIDRLAASIRYHVTVKPKRDNTHSGDSVGGEAKGGVEEEKPLRLQVRSKGSVLGERTAPTHTLK